MQAAVSYDLCSLLWRKQHISLRGANQHEHLFSLLLFVLQDYDTSALGLGQVLEGSYSEDQVGL